MIFTGSALLLISTTLALHLEDAHGVTKEDASALAEAFGAAVQRRSGVSPVLVLESPGQNCRKLDRCYAEIRNQTNAEEVIFIRLLGSLTRVRVLAERVLDGAELKRADADVDRDRSGWTAPLDGMALILYPEGKLQPKQVASTPEVKPPEVTHAGPDSPKLDLTPEIPTSPTTDPALATTSSPEPASPSILPWVVLGGSAAALIGGTIFGIRNRALVKDGKAETDETKRARIEDSVFATGLAANILLGVAVLGAATGTVLLITDD